MAVKTWNEQLFFTSGRVDPPVVSLDSASRLNLADQTWHWRHTAAAGEHGASKRRLLDPQVIAQQALEHRAKIDGGLEIATLVEVGGLQARPVGDDASASESAAGQQRHGACTVIGAVGTVDASSASELGDDGNYRLAPAIAHVGLDRRQRAVERAKQVGELARCSTLVDVSVPTNKAHRADAGAVRTGEIAGRGAGSLRKIGAHACDSRRRQLGHVRRNAVHTAGSAQRHQADATFESAGKARVRAMIEIQ